MAKALPDPQWGQVGERCFACDYALAGLAAAANCPECGTPYERPQLILRGVAMRSQGGSLGRRIAWVLVLVVGAIYLQFIALVTILAWYISAIIAVAIIAAVVWLLITGPRDRSGVERFVISRSGITRIVARTRADGKLDAALTPWGDANAAHLDRVSSVWRRLRIGRARGPGERPESVIFDAGIRCPDDMAEEVTAHLNRCLGHARPADQSPPPSAR